MRYYGLSIRPLTEGAVHSFASEDAKRRRPRFQGWAAVGRPLTMVLGPQRGSAGLGRLDTTRAGTATEAAEAAGRRAGGGSGRRVCRAAAICVHASVQRSEQS